MLQLHHGCDAPQLRVRNTLAALAVLASSGVLPADEAQLLADGYAFLRRVDNALRLAYDRPVEELEQASGDLSGVAKRMGFAGTAPEVGAELWREYLARRETIRACYDRWFDRIESGVR
jgi:glutamine synthetase adenylyltransferase